MSSNPKLDNCIRTFIQNKWRLNLRLNCNQDHPKKFINQFSTKFFQGFGFTIKVVTNYCLFHSIQCSKEDFTNEVTSSMKSSIGQGKFVKSELSLERHFVLGGHFHVCVWRGNSGSFTCKSSPRVKSVQV